jgi:hypothetical protein
MVCGKMREAYFSTHHYIRRAPQARASDGECLANQIMEVETRKTFSEVVDQFLEQNCVYGADLHIADRKLFPLFRTFWQQTMGETAHQALLGQFRVALTERGYRSTGGKRPRWYGLSLRQDQAKL